ncbi:MFS transporter [Gallaecimonas sp. GXIMD1310]|uniref:MFS transporter n=1 Tax=Gallaecimonas sp. GXIMD1310 TaxID=3131926 RepID=UPI0032539607
MQPTATLSKAPNKRLLALSLILTYVIFAILLNSVGTVIMQVISHYGVTKQQASVLEGFKDLPIAVVSFLVASLLPRIGYKIAMMSALVLVALAAVAMPLLPSFWTTKLLFLCIGVGFALVKVSVYASVGLLTDDRKGHAALMNTIEGFFMVGVLAGYWLFSAFVDETGNGWLGVYWLLAGLCVVNLVLLSRLSLPIPVSDSTQSHWQDFTDMLRLAIRPLVLVFILSAFLYVLLEQSIGTWLPTFNNQILKLPPAMSVQATSIFAASLAIGRLSAGRLLQRFNWYPVLNVCLLAMALLVVLTLPMTRNIAAMASNSWADAPLAAFLLPLIGLFMAPIYPAINSVMLSSLQPSQQAPMTGLIVVFSALGGTTGSFITGHVFAAFNGQIAFYLSLLPLAVLLVSLNRFRAQLQRL